MYYKYDNKSLTFKKVSIKQYIYSILAMGFIFSSLGFGSAIQLNSLVERIPVIIHPKTDELTMENVSNYLDELHIQHKDIVLKQISIESGNLKSTIAIENSNIIGMKLAKTRPTTTIGEQYNHAYYKHWKDCLIDYSIWQSSYARNLTKEQYLQVLSEIYAEDSNYKNKLQ